MKKFFLAAVLSLSTAGAASAAEYAPDAFGTFTLNAEAEEFCLLTHAKAGDDIDDGTPFGLTHSDGEATLNIQRLGGGSNVANTVKQDSATLRMPGSQCNTNFNVTLESVNGQGKLVNDDFASVDAPFTLAVPYTVEVDFGARDITGGAISLAGGSFQTAAPVGPTFGEFSVRAAVASDSSVRLVEGGYTDAVIFRILPTT